MSSEPEVPEDMAFERELLESARADAGPQAVREAWTRFAARLSGIILDPSGDLGGPAARGPAPATIAAPALDIRATRYMALKWLLLGAIGGSGLTAGLLIERPHSKFDRAAAESEAAPSRHAGDPVRAAPPVARTDERPAMSRTEKEQRPYRSHPPRRTEATSAASTLGARVSRIDTARTALSMGDYDQAIQLIDDYHREFTNGALAPDADVVALEAAAAKHDHSEITRRARDFLSRYPNDPHAARVSSLAEHAR